MVPAASAPLTDAAPKQRPFAPSPLDPNEAMRIMSILGCEESDDYSSDGEAGVGVAALRGHAPSPLGAKAALV